MCIFLTGFMGTGKTTVGRLLARQLGCRLVDSDAVIVERTGKSINEIFDSHGEAWFRNQETEALKDLGNQKAVISTGGGIVLKPENRKTMHENGVIINLTASPEEICLRLQHERQRPLLHQDRSVEKIAAMLDDREPSYADADYRVITDGKEVEEIVGEILEWLKTKKY